MPYFPGTIVGPGGSAAGTDYRLQLKLAGGFHAVPELSWDPATKALAVDRIRLRSPVASGISSTVIGENVDTNQANTVVVGRGMVAIGFDGENVAGVDITVPVYQFSETHYLTPSAVTQSYKLTLMGLTGTVNNTPFRGFAAGEVLFLGASGTRRGVNPDDKWEIAYKFAASPNRTGLAVGAISGIQKRGWDYLWVQYGEDVDSAAKVLIKKPVAVYIEQVYPFANFGGLGIGS